MTDTAQRNDASVNPYVCQGFNAQGDPCKSTWVSKNGWCAAHDPERQEEVRKWREKGADKQRRESRRRTDKKIRKGMGHEDSNKLYMFIRSGMLTQCKRKDLAYPEAARRLGVSPRKIKMFMEINEKVNLESRMRLGWTPTKGAIRRLYNFQDFRDEYFETEKGDKYITKPFHLRWIESLLGAINTGGRQQILSPPRHGKTELLMHFCIWLMMRNPNIRIIWITGVAGIGKNILKAIKSELEHNEKLQDDYLPPGQSFKPGRQSGMAWGKEEIEIAIRKPGIKSPTLYVCGRNATLPSRDADFIVMDDVIDIDSARSDGQREALRQHYSASIASRKTEDVALIQITSRVHPDDLAQDFLDSTEWESIVESAHDIHCQLDPDDYAAHIDCMLFPEVRSYKWLMEQKNDLANLPGIFELVYLNDPGKTGVSIFVTDIIQDCYDPRIDLGTADLPQNARLIAGLDPAATGYQASFVWGYTLAPLQLRMIDLRNDMGGGIEGAQNVIKWGFDVHGIHEWVVESNLFHGAIRKNKEILEYCNQRGIYLHPHQTDKANKHDPHFGVSSLAPLFKYTQIILPYASPEAQRKVKLYVSQLIRYVGQSGTARQKSDIVLASWFPLEVLRMRNVEYQRQLDSVDQTYGHEIFDTFDLGDFQMDDLDDLFSEMRL